MEAENRTLRQQVAELAAKLAAALAEIERLKRNGRTLGDAVLERHAVGRSRANRPHTEREPLPLSGRARNGDGAAGGGARQRDGLPPLWQGPGSAGNETVWVTEVPEPVPPLIRAYQVQNCSRQDCGRGVRGGHPDVAPDQTGATAHPG